MGISRTVSEIDGDFIQKLSVFPTPVYFMPPLTGFPSVLSMAQGVEKLGWWRYQVVEKLFR